MIRMRAVRWVTTAAVLLAACAALAAQGGSAHADARSLQQKLIAIVTRGDLPAAASPLPIQRTTLTEREVNAYFQVYGPEFLPEGVREPRISIGQGGRVTTRAVVDLDAAFKPTERSWLDPLAWVSGRVELSSTGILRTANGKGVLTIESATLNGVSVPVSVLQEVVSYYSRTPESPAGFRLGEPFDLPSSIKAVETMPGRAIVVQ